MALISEDLILTHTEGWTAIVMTGTLVQVSENSSNEKYNDKVLYRLGFDSTSAGVPLPQNTTIVTDQTVYVKPSSPSGRVLKVTVTKD